VAHADGQGYRPLAEPGRDAPASKLLACSSSHGSTEPTAPVSGPIRSRHPLSLASRPSPSIIAALPIARHHDVTVGCQDRRLMRRPIRSVLFGLAMLAVVGCGSTVAPASSPGQPGASTATSVQPGPSTSGQPAWTQTAWATASLTDVRTGETFRVADLAGRTVFIETMAVWCVSCAIQQQAAVEALSMLDREKVTWIALDVDPGETADQLAAYADDRGFDFTYALAGPTLSRALSDAFGAVVLSPPSTPVIVVGTDGQVTMTEIGQKDPDRLLELATAHGA